LTVKFLTGSASARQHLLGTVGLASFVLGALGLLWLAGWWVVSRLPGMEPIHLQQRPALIYALGLLLLGGQLMSIASCRVVHCLPRAGYAGLLDFRAHAILR